MSSMGRSPLRERRAWNDLRDSVGEFNADLPAAHGDGDRALPGDEPGQFATHRLGDGAPAGLLFRAQKD